MESSLRSRQNPLIRQLADTIESVWHETLELSPYVIPEDLGYIEGSLEGDRLTIENNCYQTPQFRKLHLELAQVGTGLDILHCVMFPHPTYELPIFGADLVGRQSGQISAAIVDLSPVRGDRTLPEAYQAPLAALPAITFSQPRELPEWGDIFSPVCLFVRPMDAAEEAQFLQRARAYLTLHCHIARSCQPLNSSTAAQAVLARQRYYCQKQQQNDKTRRILEKSFGLDWTERYMTTMLFDVNALELPTDTFAPPQ